MRVLTLIAAVAAGVLIYLFGSYSDRHGIFPMPQILALRDQFRPPPPLVESRYSFDSQGRLVGDAERQAISCPSQTDKTAIWLVLGQSNAANYAGQRYRSNFGARIVNFLDGQCLEAVSPLLGSTGTKGEYWTEAANHLIASGTVDNVILVPIAYSGTGVGQWAEDGEFNPVLVATIGALTASGYAPTQVLWDQGEYDYVQGTSQEEYRARLASVIDTLRAQGVAAPFYITIASKCLEPSNGGTRDHVADNPVTRAQVELSSGVDDIRRGIDMDALLNADDRYDDCHIGGSGADKVARAWADLLLAEQ